MGTILKTTQKLAKSNSLSIGEAFEFIKEAWTICNPDKKFKESVLQDVNAIGLTSEIVKGYYDLIIKNPAKFNLTVTDVYSKEGKLLLRIIKELNG